MFFKNQIINFKKFQELNCNYEKIWRQNCKNYKVSCYDPEFDYFIDFDILKMSHKLGYFSEIKNYVKH